jgi:hypothetical protein
MVSKSIPDIPTLLQRAKMQGNLYLVNENLNERMPILKTIELNQNKIIIY